MRGFRGQVHQVLTSPHPDGGVTPDATNGVMDPVLVKARGEPRCGLRRKLRICKGKHGGDRRHVCLGEIGVAPVYGVDPLTRRLQVVGAELRRGTRSPKIAPIKNGGRGGIRTPGPLRVAGFQDRCFQPLSHPSFAFAIRATIQQPRRRDQVYGLIGRAIGS